MQQQENKQPSARQEILSQPATTPVFIDLFNFTRNPENTILEISACYKLDGVDVNNDERTSRFVEHTRHVITIDHAKRTLDVLARMLNYYPQKPEPPKKEEKANKKKD